jgi:hypothetical protein
MAGTLGLTYTGAGYDLAAGAGSPDQARVVIAAEAHS